MKASNIGFSFLMVASVVIAGCGKYEKNPVQDLDTMRTNGKNEVQKGPEKPQVITNTVVVEKEKAVPKEQATLTSDYLIVSADSVMIFNEGQAGSFEISVRSLDTDLKLKLKDQGLPEGATLKQTASDKYTLSWTPKYNTVPYNLAIKSFKAKVIAVVSEAPAGRTDAQALTKQLDLNIIVQKTNSAPTDVVVNMADTVSEDSITKFDVTVRIVGLDNTTGETPSITIAPDVSGAVLPNGTKLRDGSRYVIADEAQKSAQYLGDFKWKVSYAFDTKNISVQPVQNAKGELLANADIATVSFLVKATSPAGAKAPAVTKKVQITLTKPVDAPKFELLGLGQESLELTPGESVTLAFSVVSAVKNSSILVELPNISTLAGAPKVSCQASKLTTAKQDCQLTWKVPCSATEAQVTQSIEMAAVATSAGRRSEVTQYSLKTKRSSKANADTCAAAGVAK